MTVIWVIVTLNQRFKGYQFDYGGTKPTAIGMVILTGLTVFLVFHRQYIAAVLVGSLQVAATLSALMSIAEYLAKGGNSRLVVGPACTTWNEKIYLR